MKKIVTLLSCSLLLSACQSSINSHNTHKEISNQHKAHQSVRANDIPKFSPLETPANENLWHTVLDDFKLDHYHINKPSVQKYIREFKRHPEYFDAIFNRAKPFIYYIHKEIRKKNMPGELLFVPVVESAYDPYAFSRGGAAGIWQIIPGTASRLGITQNWWYDGRRDIKDSTEAALDYFEYLRNEFDNDWLLAMAAYNSGEGTVRRAIRRNKRLGKDTSFWSLKLPRETKNYVPKWLALIYLVEKMVNKDDFDTLPAIDNEPYLAPVELESQIDLHLAAKLSKLTLEDVYRYNPGYNHWSTAPNGPHRLLLPIDKINAFKDALANVPSHKRISWLKYTIKPGDTLIKIANRYKTTTRVLKAINKLQSHHIRAGKPLLIPKSAYAAGTTYAHLNLAGEDNKIIHTVSPGDSLWTISKNNQVSIKDIAKWNQISQDTPLQVGQEITLWLNQSDQPLVKSRPEVVRKIRYRVRSGDSLAKIAKKFKLKVPQISQWNPRIKPQKLFPGQKLTLYVDVTRQSARA